MMRVLGMVLDVLLNPVRDRRGGIATFLAATIIPLVAFAGLAVDTSRGYLMKSRLSYALDSAALAGGRLMYSPTLRDQAINDFFNANFPANYMGASVSPLNITVDNTANTLSITTQAQMGVTLMSVLGLDEMDVAGATEVKLSAVNIEVAVVLDITGSMGGSKIASLKTAAKNLIDIVVKPPAQQTPFYSKVALVPYSNSVNVGSYADAIRGATGGVALITGVSRTDPVVVTAPNHGFLNGDKVFIADVQGMRKVNNNFPENQWEEDGSNYAPPRYTVKNKTTNTFELWSSGGGSPIDGTGFSNYTSGGTVGKVCTSPGCEYIYFESAAGTWRTQRTTTCVSERTGVEAYTEAAPNLAPVAPNYTNFPYSSAMPFWPTYTGGNNHSGYNHPCPTSEIVPLTIDKTLLSDKVDAMSAGGSTAGHIGVAWGWYMLSPEFGYLWPDTENVPGDYDPAKLQKVVVMMTDGEFNTIYSDGVIAKNSGSGSGGSRYKIDQNGDNGQDSFQQALALCTNMKGAGVQIYTIGFDIGGSSTIQNFLDNCATDATHAFVANSGTDLENVFHQIAVQISQLRLAK